MNYIENFIGYLQATKNSASKTIKAYRSDLKQFARFEQNLLAPDICGYVTHLSGKLSLKDSSVKRKIVTLKIFYEYLALKKTIGESPFFQLKFHFKQETRLPKTLTTKEVSRLLGCFRMQPDLLSPFARREYTRDAALIDLLIGTGIRIGEAAAITLGDIQFSERTLLIHGKGRKQRILYISSGETWTRLKCLAQERKKIARDCYLFVNRYGHPITIQGIENIYRKYALQANIARKTTPHYLRHTFATNLLVNGADIRSVQELLGHASLTTTQIYTEVNADRKKKVLLKYNYRNKL